MTHFRRHFHTKRYFSEPSRQVHLSRNKCLIKWDRYQHATSKVMDCMNDALSVIWKSYLTDKMKHSFFQAAVESILLYGCTTWRFTKRVEKKLDCNHTRMLQSILNKFWRQHSTKNCFTATYQPSQKISKLDESDMRDTVGEIRTNS